jgi:hypothetical protein
LYLVWTVGRATPLEGGECAAFRRIDIGGIDRGTSVLPCKARRVLASTLTEDEKIRERVAALSFG